MLSNFKWLSTLGFLLQIVYRVNHSPMKYTIINDKWKHDFYRFSMELSILNLHVLQVYLWNDCQNTWSNARSLHTWCLTTGRRCQVTWLAHSLYVHIQIQISPCTNSPKIPNINPCVFVYVCLNLSLFGGEEQSIYIYVCVTAGLRHSISHYVEIQISALTELLQSST